MAHLPEHLDTILGHHLKSLPDTCSCLGTHAHARDAVLETESSQFLLGDLNILAVCLISDNNHLHLFIGVLLDLTHPELLNVLESLSDLQVEDENDSLCVFIVCAGDGAESLLACGIPDL